MVKRTKAVSRDGKNIFGVKSVRTTEYRERRKGRV